jgi:hypothetical protein
MPEEVGQEWAAQIRDQIAALPRDRYPYLLANLDVMVNGTGDERFAFGIDMLIASMAAQIPASRGRAAVTPRRRPQPVNSGTSACPSSATRPSTWPLAGALVAGDRDRRPREPGTPQPDRPEVGWPSGFQRDPDSSGFCGGPRRLQRTSGSPVE